MCQMLVYQLKKKHQNFEWLRFENICESRYTTHSVARSERSKNGECSDMMGVVFMAFICFIWPHVTDITNAFGDTGTERGIVNRFQENDLYFIWIQILAVN